MGRRSPLARRLLAWYAKNARDLPFRRTRDPYRILVAEVALQQTRVEQGLPFLERFMERFPDVGALARASDDDVLRAWEGLGYYRRATALRAAARRIVKDHGGALPRTFEELVELPGVGPYTAGAVASIAFGERVPAVDGNAARVLSRHFMIDESPSGVRGLAAYRAKAASLLDPTDPGAFNQALMELGAVVCRPRNPACGRCPLSATCQARAAGQVADFPPARASRVLPEVQVAFALVQRGGQVLAVRRGRGALLAGMWGLPGGDLRAQEGPEEALRRSLSHLGLRLQKAEEVHRRRKEFSSRVWDARVFRCHVAGRPARAEHARWFDAGEREKVPFVPFQRDLLDRMGL